MHRVPRHTPRRPRIIECPMCGDRMYVDNDDGTPEAARVTQEVHEVAAGHIPHPDPDDR